LAYLLRYPATSSTVNLDSSITLTGDFEVVIDYEKTSGLSGTISELFSSSDNDTNCLVRQSDGLFLLRLEGSSEFRLSGLTIPDRVKFKVTRVGNLYSLEMDGVASGSDTVISDGIIIDRLNFAGITCDLYEFKVFNSSGTLIHDLDPSASNGTGTILLDEAGTNDGTLDGFTGTTNSWWVFYDDGGGVSIPVIMNHLRNQGIA
jgi:hypothetical protein